MDNPTTPATEPATPDAANSLPPIDEPEIKTVVLPDIVSSANTPAAVDTILPLDPNAVVLPKAPAAQALSSAAKPAAPSADTAGEGKFKVVIILIVVALVVAGAAIFFLLTDQGRSILGLDRPATNNQQSNNQNTQTTQAQTATQVDAIVKDLEDELDKIDPDTAFGEFDEQAEFGVGIN
jgi:uncharacterized protein HemX